MRIPPLVLETIRRRLLAIPARCPPDEMIGPGARVRLRDYGGHGSLMPEPSQMFLRRWFLHSKSNFTNSYLHEFCGDDEDRALHDHPWFNFSCLLAGQYVEHTIASGGVHRRCLYRSGDLKFRAPWAAHRIELTAEAPPEDVPFLRLNSRGQYTCWSLFTTGWRMHHWGFHCPTEFRTNEQFADQGGCPGSDYQVLNLYKKENNHE